MAKVLWLDDAIVKWHHLVPKQIPVFASENKHFNAFENVLLRI